MTGPVRAGDLERGALWKEAALGSRGEPAPRGQRPGDRREDAAMLKGFAVSFKCRTVVFVTET